MSFLELLTPSQGASIAALPARVMQVPRCTPKASSKAWIPLQRAISSKGTHCKTSSAGRKTACSLFILKQFQGLFRRCFTVDTQQHEGRKEKFERDPWLRRPSGNFVISQLLTNIDVNSHFYHGSLVCFLCMIKKQKLISDKLKKKKRENLSPQFYKEKMENWYSGTLL